MPGFSCALSLLSLGCSLCKLSNLKVKKVTRRTSTQDVRSKCGCSSYMSFLIDCLSVVLPGRMVAVLRVELCSLSFLAAQDISVQTASSQCSRDLSSALDFA
jgi:hypothetical protein